MRKEFVQWWGGGVNVYTQPGKIRWAIFEGIFGFHPALDGHSFSRPLPAAADRPSHTGTALEQEWHKLDLLAVTEPASASPPLCNEIYRTDPNGTPILGPQRVPARVCCLLVMNFGEVNKAGEWGKMLHTPSSRPGSPHSREVFGPCSPGILLSSCSSRMEKVNLRVFLSSGLPLACDRSPPSCSHTPPPQQHRRKYHKVAL